MKDPCVGRDALGNMVMSCSAVVMCVVVVMSVQCTTDLLPPPGKLSCVWTDEFHVRMTWQRPNISSSCEVKYEIYVSNYMTARTTGMFHKVCITTEEIGSTGIWCTAETQNVNRSCGLQNASKPVNQTIYPPVDGLQLVRNFTCSLYSANAMDCYWIPAKQIPDLQLFYGLCEDPVLSLCKHIYSNGTKKGCHLNVHTEEIAPEVCIQVNGTLNGRHVRNTFKRKPFGNVKTPAPTLHITEQQDNLTLNWTQARIGTEYSHCWSYIVNYTECDKHKEKSSCQNSLIVPYNKNCQYVVQVRAVLDETCGTGGSDISAVAVHGENEHPDLSLVLLILIPAILSACVILACYCFRRHRAMICPDIPDPSVLFKEMMNSNKEPMNMGNLYIPVQEDVESCKIIPVMENGPTAKLLTHAKL